MGYVNYFMPETGLEKTMETIKNIIAEKGEDCKVDIDMLEDGLSKLPTAAYIELYHKMQTRLYGYPNFVGCCCTIGESKPELKAKIDYSEVEEVMEKVEEANQVAEKLSDLIKELQHKHVPIYVDVVEKGE